jgi:hypothetical protein
MPWTLKEAQFSFASSSACAAGLQQHPELLDASNWDRLRRIDGQFDRDQTGGNKKD